VRKTLVAGNWKLNGSKASIAELLKDIVSGMSSDPKSDTQVAVCAPYIYIPYVQDILTKVDAESKIWLGSEDISMYESGAYTGEVSGSPILCVGEKLKDREKGITKEIVASQLDAIIELEGVNAFKDAVIAYEPVWAIGTGMTATSEQAQEVHAFMSRFYMVVVLMIIMQKNCFQCRMSMVD